MVEEMAKSEDALQKMVDAGGCASSMLASLSVIALSEIGDKTFFIAAILAMRHSCLLVFSGTMTANTIMFILTVGLGYVMTVVPPPVTRLVSAVFFAVFGIQLIKEGWTMSPNESEEELEEAEEEIRKIESQVHTHVWREDSKAGRQSEHGSPNHRPWAAVTSSSFVRAFSLTFVAEWGDRSQISTILLGARQDVLGILIGGILGHTLCTGFAVVSGHVAAKYISLPKVHIMGGLVFLIFAVSTLLID